MKVGMVLETAIPEHMTVLSSAVQQVLHTEIHIQPILETTVVALNIDAYVIGFLNEVELLVMSHIAYVCHRRELLGKSEPVEAGEHYAEVVDTLSAILVPTLGQLHIVSAVPNTPRERNAHVQHQSLRRTVVLQRVACLPLAYLLIHLIDFSVYEECGKREDIARFQNELQGRIVQQLASQIGVALLI